MKRNTITVEQGYTQDDIDNITTQLPYQLSEISELSQGDEVYEDIEIHFLFVLANDFYKDALTAEQIAEMERYLPENYQDTFFD